MSKALLALLFCTVLYSDDVMVQRLQSVVDEVSELRSFCELLKKENKRLKETNKLNEVKESQIQELKTELKAANELLKEEKTQNSVSEQENNRLMADKTSVIKELKKELKSLKERLKRVQTEKTELLQKNKKLISKLVKKNAKLKRELFLLSQKKSKIKIIAKKCIDDNPFPKLKMKKNIDYTAQKK